MIIIICDYTRVGKKLLAGSMSLKRAKTSLPSHDHVKNLHKKEEKTKIQNKKDTTN